ncbi:glycosyltransferase family 4 protein [soil metagenome]
MIAERTAGPGTSPSGPGEDGDARPVPRVLVVTNDFPPRFGGAQQYVWNLVRSLPADRVAVLAPNSPGWREHDRGEGYPVHRWPGRTLLPTMDVARRTRSLVREHRSEVVLFGHGMLAVMGPHLTRAGVPYVALTHGWEVWVARTPGLAAAMRRGMRGAQAMIAVSEYTGRSISGALGLTEPFRLLYPGVDPDRFSPGVDGGPVRERHGLGSRPVVLCVSRLVPRKGQDVLIRAMAPLRALVPGAALLIAGAGPYGGRLREIAAEAPAGSVVFAGGVPAEDLPSHYAACDAFAMPCRSRWGGLEVEGFGIVYLEAAATAKPVLAGRSGGAGEAVADRVTGFLVEPREPKAVSLSLARLLGDRVLAARFGKAGRLRVESEFTWERQAGHLAAILADAAG